MAGIKAIEYVLPDRILDNNQLAEDFPAWTPEKIYKKTGIRTRHLAEENETSVDLGTRAAEKLIKQGTIAREEIDFIVFVTQTPDYILPTSACIIQDRLGLKKSTGALDINLGCSGFVYGLAVAKGLVDSGAARNLLLITADTYSKHVNKLDRSTRTIFGDGAAATLIGREGYRIGEFDLGTDGSGHDLLKIPSGGARLPKSPATAIETESEGNIRSQDDLYMDGPGIFEFTLREVPQSIRRLLEKTNTGMEDIDLFVFHQANSFMLEYLQKIMKIEKDRFIINMSDIGNTISASIPIALKRVMEEGGLEGKKTVLLSGFGVGLSWGSTLLSLE